MTSLRERLEQYAQISASIGHVTVDTRDAVAVFAAWLRSDEAREVVLSVPVVMDDARRDADAILAALAAHVEAQR